MLETLLAFSLVKRLSENRLLSIHRLVQVVQMERLSAEEQRQWAERIVLALNAIFPRNPVHDFASWPQCLRYLEQVQACDALIQRHQLLLTEAADVLNRTGAYLANCALFALAEQLYQRALCIWEQQLGPEHPDVAEILDNLANLYRKQGRYAEAEPLYQRALHIREQMGAEHPETAETLHDYAAFQEMQGKQQEARSLYQRALYIREQALGTRHPKTTETRSRLMALLDALGQHEQAAQLEAVQSEP
jgi:tetratricopeptide (TPR) repeat protein